jgi:ubiquinone/menaquinone biosynthesis C-methylase UbiE
VELLADAFLEECMMTGNRIELREHIAGFQDEIGKNAEQGKDAFFTWFNDSIDTDTAFIRGSWDFLVHIGLPIAKYLDHPEDKTILEIGHGGGRILASACRSFKTGIGVDIHNNNALVDSELKKRGIANFKLLQSNGKTVPVENDTVDIVYSFIVFQHLERIEIFNHYFEETYRILRSNGIAVLYFGRKSFFSHNRKSVFLYWIDRILENLLLFKRGFVEIPAKVNETNLIVSLYYVKRLVRRLGFEILGIVVSHKKVPDGVSLFGGQHGLILRKIPVLGGGVNADTE